MMWGTLTSLCLLGLLKTGAPQNVTTEAPASTSTNGGDATTSATSPGDNKMCINPTQFTTEETIGADIQVLYDNLHHMRGWSLVEIIPGAEHGCGILRLQWTDELKHTSAKEANTCPMEGEPYVLSFRRLPEQHGQGSIGLLIVFGRDPEKLRKVIVEPWDDITATMTKDLTPEKIKALSLKYETGPWDPVFQLFWADSGHAGCAVTKYNNSDTAAMSRIFHEEINETLELWNVVCTFKPAGCEVGLRSWDYCNTEESTGTEESGGTTSPMSPETLNPTPPNPTPPHPMTQTPHAAGKRIGQGMGLNFESLTILVTTILSVNLVHMRIPTFT